MEAFEQEERLEEALAKVLEHHSREYSMTLAQVIGVLELMKQALLEQNRKCDCEDEE